MFDAAAALGKILEDLDRDAREPTQLRAVLVPQLKAVIERGHKEASSEVLFSIATALGLSLSDLMSAVSAKLAVLEAERAPRGRMVVAA